MTKANAGIAQDTLPFKPSWIDRVNDWIEKLPLPPWLFYSLVGTALILLQMLFLWLDGGLKTISLLPVIAYNAMALPYAVAFVHLLDSQAIAALHSMIPALALDRGEYEDLEYRLSTMPPWRSFFVGLFLVCLLIITELGGVEPARYAALDTLPRFTVVYQVLDKLSAVAAGVLVYHTIRQLRLVNSIYARHARINLFDLRPIYAFSKLTATTAVGLLIPEYGWMLINPELMRNPLGLGGTLAFTILSVAVFALPLLGAHRLMEHKKQRMLHQLDLGFEAVFARFNKSFGDGDFAAVDRLNGTIASLETQYRRISSIPTWPWRHETARFVMSVIATPLILTIVQFLIGRLFGG
ncbi:MAG: hypothetical protein PVF70_02630 [Anaerolineales bacterium]|jgi:hypothetical protein